MIQTKRFLLILALFSFTATCYAQSKQERWYTHWALGAASIEYPEETGIGETFDYLESIPGIDRMKLSMDLLGIYFPVGDNMLAGFVVNTGVDHLEADDGTFLQMGLYTYSFSTQYYPQQIGQGLFGRLDVGVAISSVMFGDNDYDDSVESDPGIGALLGIGYAYPITPGNRITLNLNYSVRRIEDEYGDENDFSVVGLSIGGLF